jgi:hypothetical protein
MIDAKQKTSYAVIIIIILLGIVTALYVFIAAQRISSRKLEQALALTPTVAPSPIVTPAFTTSSQRVAVSTASPKIASSPTPSLVPTNKLTKKTISVSLKPSPTLITSKINVALPPQKYSQSKLGIFVITSYSAGTKKIIQSEPRVLKVMDPQKSAELRTVMKDYKTAVPEGVVVLRIYDKTKFSREDDPQSAAVRYFDLVIKPGLNALKDDKKYINYIEPTNEFDNTPNWDTKENVQWLNQFWSSLIDLINAEGVKVCVASLPVGNPPGEMSEIKDKLSLFLPAMQKANRLGGAFCYHSYTTQYTTDIGIENFYSLRYRFLHQMLIELDSSMVMFPFILSEAGVDDVGDPAKSGWLARGNTDQYKQWLQWFDSEIRKDQYVLGATLFQIGDPNWSSFNIESIANWLSDYLSKSK